MLWAYIPILVVILFLIYIFITYNKFVSLDNKVKEAFSTMDVYLKKRWDLIPNIVDTVKGYADYEKETLENVVSLRSGVYDNMSYEDKLKKIVKGRIISVEEKMTYVRNIMKENESVRFTSLIESNDKNEVIATFLSMLELIKTNEVFVVQDLFLGDILIKRSMEC